MTAYDDLYENGPLDDEALDELLTAADAELLDHVQRHADPTYVLDALMAADEDVHGRDCAARPVRGHLRSRPLKPIQSISGSASETDRVAAVRRRSRCLVAFGAAAAVALIAVTPATRWLWPGWPDDRSGNVRVSSAPRSVNGAEVLQTTNRKTGVTAKITIEPTRWGTQVDFELSGIRGPLRCQFVVVTHSSKTEVVTSWQVPAHESHGVPGSPKPLRLQGGTAYSRGDIDHFEIRTTTGSNLVNVLA
jgi:hypothetical protein